MAKQALKETYIRMFKETPDGRVVKLNEKTGKPMVAATPSSGLTHGFSDDEIQQLAEKCGWDGEKIADLTLALFAESNHKTLVKYLGRFFADLERNNFKVEDTLLYQAGY